MMRDCLNQAVYGAKRSAIREFSKMAAATPGCLRLTLGEPDFDTPKAVSDELFTAAKNKETHYIDNNGTLSLRQKIVAFEKQKNGVNYTADEVIVTGGATEALFVALFGILNPDDEVIVPTPAFVLYEEIIKLCRGKFIPLDTEPDGFQIRSDKLGVLITDKTKAIVLNTPNNPTGTVYDDESLKAVYDAVQGKPIFVICDDVYRQLIYTEKYKSFTEFAELKEQILLVQSFSKPYAMTGWRVGYLLSDQSVKERLELVHQFLLVSAPSLFQRACEKALETDVSEFVNTYRKRRDYVLKRLNTMGLQVIPPQGAFYVFPSVKEFELTDAEFCTRLIGEEGLALTPGFCFGGAGYVRISYCYDDQTLADGMDRLERFVQKLRKEKGSSL